jgi:hypothetical protein
MAQIISIRCIVPVWIVGSRRPIPSNERLHKQRLDYTNRDYTASYQRLEGTYMLHLLVPSILLWISRDERHHIINMVKTIETKKFCLTKSMNPNHKLCFCLTIVRQKRLKSVSRKIVTRLVSHDSQQLPKSKYIHTRTDISVTI